MVISKDEVQNDAVAVVDSIFPAYGCNGFEASKMIMSAFDIRFGAPLGERKIAPRSDATFMAHQEPLYDVLLSKKLSEGDRICEMFARKMWRKRIERCRSPMVILACHDCKF